MHLSHPEYIPLDPVCGKIFFHKISPWCQKDWDSFSRAQVHTTPFSDERIKCSPLHVNQNQSSRGASNMRQKEPCWALTWESA